MSSLRLALKQSLAESGHLVAQQKQKEKERRQKEEEERRRKEKKRRQRVRQQEPGRKSKNQRDAEPSSSRSPQHMSLQSHLEKGGNSATIHITPHVGGSSSRRSVSSSTLSGTSSESSSSGDSHSDDSSTSSGDSRTSDGESSSSGSDSHSDDSSSDDHSTSSSSDDGMEMEGVFDSEVSSDEDDADESSSKRRKKKEKKQMEKNAQKNNAANTIQNRWKKKSSAGDSRRRSPTSMQSNVARKKRRESIGHSSESSSSHQRKSSKQKRKSGGGSSKKSSSSSSSQQTVSPPATDIVSWMRGLSTGKQRRNIASGQRVKVRFATKSNKKGRDGRVTRKLKWYGGLVTDVSTGGKRIRIKYDDETSEVADFPDKDIVVDSEGNGRHRVSADAFIPRLPSSPEVSGRLSPREVPVADQNSQGLESDSEEEKDFTSRNREMATARADRGESSSPPTSEHPLSARSAGAVSPLLAPQKCTPPSCNSSSGSASSARSLDQGDSSVVRQSVDVVEPGGVRRRISSEDRFSPVSGANPTTAETGASNSKGDDQAVDDMQKERTLTIKLIPPRSKKDGSNSSSVPDSVAPTHVKDVVSNGRNSSPDSHRRKVATPKLATSTGDQENRLNRHTSPVAAVVTETGDTPDIQSEDMATGKRRLSPVVVSMDEPPPKKMISEWGCEGRRGGDADPGSTSDSGSREDDSPMSAAVRGNGCNTSLTDRRKGAWAENDRRASPPCTEVEFRNGVSKLKKTSKDSRSVSHTSPASSSLVLSLGRNKRKRDRSRSPVPERRSSGSRSPRRVDSPTPMSGDLKRSSASVSKPVSSICVADADSGSEENVGGACALSGSTNSAFVAKVGRSSPAHLGADANQLFKADSGSDAERSAPSTPADNPNVDSGGSSKGANIPTARSGRRAAQKANERIVAKQEIVIVDEYAKRKRKKARDEPDLRLFPTVSSSADADADDEDGDTVDEDEEEEERWVQCDRCMKWRLLPCTVQMDELPERWYCELNVHDLKRNRCSAPEQTAEEIANEKKSRKGSSATRAESPIDHDTESDHEGEHQNVEPAPPMQTVSVEARSDSPRERASGKSPRSDGEHSADSPPELATDMSHGTKSPRQGSASSSNGKQAPQSPSSDSATDDSQGGTSSRKGSSNGGEGSSRKTASSGDDAVSSALNEAGSDNAVVMPSKSKNKNRNRSRDKKDKDTEKSGKSGKGQKQSKEAERQEWVQCEKCEKWRRLPPRISAADLPDVWYCSMNDWDARTASCDAEEDQIDSNVREYTIMGAGATASTAAANSGKLSYRNLIFGTGRKHSRPVSERTRAAESLFSNQLSDTSQEGAGAGPPVVMYANSSAFVCKGGNKLPSDDGGKISFLDLMSHSQLWAELYCGAHALHSLQKAPLDGFNNKMQTGHTNGASSEDMQQSMKALVYRALGSGTLEGHEVLLEAQCQKWGDADESWRELRAYCTIEFVTFCLGELVKDGLVEVVHGKLGDSHRTVQYRRVLADGGKESSKHCEQEVKRSRCMKIAKPWKKPRASVGNEWCM